MNNNTMVNASKIKSAEKVLQTHKTVAVMMERGLIINYYTVAMAVDVSRQFLYNHTDLRQLIEDCRVSGMTKEELQREVIRLRLKIRDLEVQLEQILDLAFYLKTKERR